jgi:hypothetical protein
MKTARSVTALIAAATLLAGGVALAADAAGEPAAVVNAFNAAVTARNLDKTLAYLIAGGVQFNLRPAHTGLGGAPQGVSTDLRAHWSTVGSLLFTATKSYSRKVEIIDSRVADDIATVWTKTNTETVRGDKPEASKDSFVEVYLLLRKDGQWKISAVADSRRPNDVGLGGTP